MRKSIKSPRNVMGRAAATDLASVLMNGFAKEASQAHGMHGLLGLHCAGAAMQEKSVYDWGQSPNLAPSIKRANPLSWIAASAFFGAVGAWLGLALVWRPLPWLPGPLGSLVVHAGYVAELSFHAVFPAFFGTDAREYLAWLTQRSDSERNALIWRTAFGLWCFLMPWVFLADGYLRGRDGLIYLRGSMRLAGKAAVGEINRKLAARVKRRPDHEIAPGVPYPADMWTRHVLLVGGVGSGKSTAMRPLIDKVVSAGEQLILFDPKSEFTMGFGGPELIAPWDARSLSWDIARDMRNLLDMRRFAATMIKESQDPMWSNASRQLLVGLMIYLKNTRKNDWGWMELKDLISLPQANLLEIMRRWHPEAERAVEKASVTTAGILINLASFCSSIFDLAEAWGAVPANRRVSFVDWIQGRSAFKQIILQGHGAYAELTRSYVEGIVGVVSAMVNSVEMADDPLRKIWFIADEFGQMGKIPVRPLFEVGRSRGVRCVVACQDFAQLEEIHGAQMVRALVGMCGTLLVGQVMQGETAEQLCKAFGAREVERTNLSSSSSGGSGSGAGSGGSTTLSYNRDEVPLYKPSELTSRLGLTEDGLGVVLLLFTGGNAYELNWPLYEIRQERVPHVPAPWTYGGGADWGNAGLAMADEAARVADATPKPEQTDQKSGEDGLAVDAKTILLAPSQATEVQAPQAFWELPMEKVEPEQSLLMPGDGAKITPDGGLEVEEPMADAIQIASNIARHDPVRLLGVAKSAARSAPTLEQATAPKEAIVVQTLAVTALEEVAEPGGEPVFDAVAELAAMKLGLHPIGIAIEVLSALESSTASTISTPPKQRVHMGNAQRVPPMTGQHHT
jgi:hypothetical protein